MRTANEMGWSTLTNGQLLSAAEGAGFTVLVTTDQNIVHQQNLRDRALAVVILGSTRWSRIRLVLDHIAAAIESVAPGSVTQIEVPR